MSDEDFVLIFSICSELLLPLSAPSKNVFSAHKKTADGNIEEKKFAKTKTT